VLPQVKDMVRRPRRQVFSVGRTVVFAILVLCCTVALHATSAVVQQQATLENVAARTPAKAQPKLLPVPLAHRADNDGVRALRALEDAIPVTIAYCVYPENNAVPPGHSEFMARTYGPYIFPAPRFKLQLRAVLPLPEDLPKGVEPTSAKALDMLGLTNAHIRFCPKGSSQLIRLMLDTKQYVMATGTFERARERLQSAGMWTGVNAHGWSHDGWLHWPAEFSFLARVDTGAPALPLIFRHSPEPVAESVKGVPVQLDVKRTDLSSTSVTMFWPMILDSMAFRWAHGNSTYGRKIGGRFETIRDVVVRAPGFDAARERASKQHFASSVTQHCAGRRAHYPSVAVRELFTYALAERAQRAVHNAGECPLGDVGATRALLSVSARADMRQRYHSHSVAAIHGEHKFAIAFENSGQDGYFTEKVVSAYVARSVPVYSGPASLAGVLNAKAVIHCALPYNLTSFLHSVEMKKRVCKALPPLPSPCNGAGPESECEKEHGRNDRDRCAAAYQAALETAIWPQLLECADRVLRVDRDDAAYDAMLAEPLVPLDARGDMTGIWNLTSIGWAMRAIVVGLGGL